MQPVLSLAQRYELAPEQAFRKLAGFFYHLGADTVLDMTMADDFVLLEAAKEFVERYKASKEGVKDQLPMLSSSCPGKINDLKKRTLHVDYSQFTNSQFSKLQVGYVTLKKLMEISFCHT